MGVGELSGSPTSAEKRGDAPLLTV